MQSTTAVDGFLRGRCLFFLKQDRQKGWGVCGRASLARPAVPTNGSHPLADRGNPPSCSLKPLLAGVRVHAVKRAPISHPSNAEDEQLLPLTAHLSPSLIPVHAA